MCFQPKIKTPAPTATITLPEPIRATPDIKGVEYGGQNDTASGNSEATVAPVDNTDNTDTTTEVTPTSTPTYQNQTTVTTEETQPTKLQKKTVSRKSAV